MLREALFDEMKGRHQGRRFVRADEGRAVCLWHIVQDRRRAAALLPQSRVTAARKISCWTAMPRPRARPISASRASIIRRPSAACSGDSTTRAPNSSRCGCAISPREDVRRRRSQHGGSGVWAPAIDGFYYTRARRQPSAVQGFLPRARHAIRRTTMSIYEENDPGFFVECRRHPPERLDHRSRSTITKPRNIGSSTAGDPAMPQTRRRAARDRPPIRHRGRRRHLLHPDQRGRRQGLQDR